MQEFLLSLINVMELPLSVMGTENNGKAFEDVVQLTPRFFGRSVELTAVQFTDTMHSRRHLPDGEIIEIMRIHNI